MQTVKNGDCVYLGDGVFGHVSNVYTDAHGYEKVQCLLDDSEEYIYKSIPIELVKVIPTLTFANERVVLTKVKPGVLVQAVDTGEFHHIVRLVTALSGYIYIQTTISDSITHAPDDLTYIG